MYANKLFNQKLSRRDFLSKAADLMLDPYFMQRYTYKQRNNFTGHSLAERFTLENNRMSIDPKILYDINAGTPYGSLSLKLALRAQTSAAAEHESDEDQEASQHEAEVSSPTEPSSSPVSAPRRVNPIVMRVKLKKSDLPSNTPPRKHDHKQHCNTCLKSAGYSGRNSKPTEHQCILCSDSICNKHSEKVCYICFDRIKSFDLQERMSSQSERKFKRQSELSKEEMKNRPKNYCRTCDDLGAARNTRNDNKKTLCEYHLDGYHHLCTNHTYRICAKHVDSEL